LIVYMLPTTAFLDRDGVINRKMPDGSYVESWEDFEFLPGAVEALQMLAAAGVRVVVVTNQRGVALGRMSMAAVDEIHHRMQARLSEVDACCAAILVCPHDHDACDCRKPGLGLFRRAEALMPEIDLDTSIVVGDSASDLLAGNGLGCASYLVGDEERLAAVMAEHPDLIVAGRASSLRELVDCFEVSPPNQDPA
jgi:D-glycero-D-manno-heptose 1,7-bisphosphate phosphatase